MALTNLIYSCNWEVHEEELIMQRVAKRLREEGPLGPEHKRAGMTLREPDDHLVILERDGCILGVFSATIAPEVIRQAADQWLVRLPNGGTK